MSRLAFTTVTAIVGVVLAYAALASGSSGTGADDACTPSEAACEAQFPTHEPTTYATPVEVDCPAATDGSNSAGRPERQLFSDDCGLPVFDFRYRVSRTPDSERPTGSLGPQRARRAARPIDTTSGLPNDPGPLLSSVAGQPIAVYALISLTPPVSKWVYQAAHGRIPVRILEPLDRPPRA